MLILPKIIGHRAAAGVAPENTLTAIHTAADMGCTWVELDVKLTKDFVPVIFHDDTLLRTAGADIKMSEITYKDLADLEVGNHFGESFSGEPVPTLEQALDVIIERDLGFNCELKPCPAREVETTEAVLDMLATYWEDSSRLLLSSFNIQCLELCLEAAPEWARGYLLGEDIPENWQKIADHIKPETININGNTITEEWILKLAAYNKPLLAYTINDEDRAEWLFERGVKAVFSDMPDLI